MFRDVSTMPSFEFDDPNGYDYLVRVKHYQKDKSGFLVGRMLEDGFYLASGGELNHDWNIIGWHPLLDEEV